jgi:polyisoprenoid-binding protein YceI
MKKSLVIAAALAGAAMLHAQGTQTFHVEPAKSLFTLDVGKTGLFSSMAGHAHVVETRAIEGTVEFDAQAIAKSSVRVRIDAASLRVAAKGEPPDDVPKVQEMMLSERVLDVHRYPAIVFESTSVAPATGAREPLTLSVTGKLTLHNVTKTITVPVTVRVEGETLTAKGETTIKQTDFGISPVSVAGVVKVRDAVGISFSIAAKR